VSVQLRQLAASLRRLLADEERRYLLVHSLSGLSMRVAGVVLITAVTILFTRLMGAEEYGRVAFLLSGSFIVVLLAGLGLPTASLRLLPRYAVRGRGDLVGHYLVVGLLLTIGTAAIGGLGLGVVLVATPSLARDYGFPLLSVVALVISVALMRFASETSRACGLQLVGFAGESVAVRLILLAMLTFYLTAGATLGADVAVLMWVGAQGSVAIAVAVLVFRRVRPGIAALRWRQTRLYRGWLGVSTIMLVTPVYYFLLYETDAVMLGILAGPGEVGIYQVARRLAEFVVFCAAVASAVGLPRLAAAHAARRVDKVQATVDTMNGIALISTTATVLALTLVGPWALRLFGHEFAGGYLPMLILAVARLVALVFGPASDLLLMTGHHGRLGKVNLVCAVANIALNFLLIPRFGVLGAASATGGALIAWSAWLYFLARRHTPIETCLFRRAPALLLAARARG
jgi:O-antigen/teichoic acid export membrane protein